MPSALWTTTADVYTRTAATGAYTTLAKADLVCRLALQSYQASGVDPSTGQPAPRLLWQDTTYSLPHSCQVEVAGVRYTPIHGSEKAPAPLGTALYRAVDLIRAET